MRKSIYRHTEARIRHGLKHAGDEAKADHSPIGLGRSLRHEEDAPEEDIDRKVFRQRELTGVLHQSCPLFAHRVDLRQQEISWHGPDQPADVEDRGKIRVIFALKMEVLLDAEKCSI